jgi:multiple sugar transport system permease protein
MTTRLRGDNAIGVALVTPALVLIIAFILAPMGMAFRYSLMKWNLLGPMRYVGLSNYQFLLTKDNTFAIAIFNTVLYALGVSVLTIVLSLGTALMLTGQSRKEKLARTLVFLPVVVPPAVMGLIWRMLYEPKFGFINQLLGVFGIHGLNWLYDTNVALFSVMIFSLWKDFGLYTIIFVGALQRIPLEIYESARLDGAGFFRTLLKITVPTLAPIMFFVVTMLGINTFKAFDHIWVMTQGGPGYATTVLVTFIYARVFNSVGIAAAASVFLFVMIFVLTMIQFRFRREE